MASEEPNKELFPDLDSEAMLDGVQVIESLCMACGENGTTRILMTQIPYFREVVLMAFTCPHCNFRSNEIQPAATLAPKAVTYTLRVEVERTPHEALGGWLYTNAGEVREDLDRQLIRTKYARILVPELELEVPAATRSEVTTIEGILSRIATDLEAQQEARAKVDPFTSKKLQTVIDRLQEMTAGHESFTLILDDPSGNSFLANPAAPAADPRSKVFRRERTQAEMEALGYSAEGAGGGAKQQQTEHEGTMRSFEVSMKMQSKLDTFFRVTERSAVMPGECHGCHRSCETRVCLCDIPHFKEVCIMVTQCDHCGFKHAEVKPAGAMSEKGKRVTLKVLTPRDLARDIMKSDTASLQVPELQLSLEEGTLGGKYTTVEGILTDIRAQLVNTNAFSLGDSATEEEKAKVTGWLEKFDRCLKGTMPFTLVLDDPMGNVCVFAEDGSGVVKDPQVVTEEYERSFEQNEVLGLNDMNTEHYEETQPEEEKKEEEDHIAKEVVESEKQPEVPEAEKDQ